MAAAFLCPAQKETDVSSTIESVTVFMQGAQVNRSASVNLVEGEQVLVFRNVAPELNEESIQISSDQSITILDLRHQINHYNDNPAFLDSLRNVNQQLESTAKIIESLRNQIRTTLIEERILLENSQFQDKGESPTLDLQQKNGQSVKLHFLDSFSVHTLLW